MIRSYRLKSSSMRWHHGIRLQLGCLLLSAVSMVGYAQDTPAGAAAGNKDYFTQQPADTPLVIRMDAFETEFESRVFDPKDILLKASGLSGQRLGAVYQFIEASAEPRQLRIEVSLGHGTDRSRLDMQVTRFEPGGPDKRAVMQAYRLLSTGLELPASDRADEWTLKVIALMQAGNLFNDLGMQEMYLWSAYYAHHYLLAFLDDPVTAAEGGREIYAAATRSRLGDLALAALQLQGSATAGQAAGKDKPIADGLYDQAQDLFRQAAELAGQMDYQHERAKAIYHSGLAFEAAGDTGRAFEQFEQAIDVATGCGDSAFANQVRQHAAELHESLGDNAEAIAMMQQINAESPAGNAVPDVEPEDTTYPEDAVVADGELVNYLLEQGRLLEKTYRHAEAAEVLRQALELNRKSASPSLSGPMALLLAKSLYGAGQFDAALKYLLEGIKKTPSFRHEDILYEAYGILAAIQRFRGDFAAMSAARERQQLFIATPGAQAGFTFESALDQLAAGRNSASAVALLRQSEQEARAAGAKTLQQLARLQLCLVGDPCDPAVAQDAQNAVRESGLPVPALEARLLWAEILRREGQRSRAASELDGLIEDMRFFQSDLPGVLGAWYWQNREAVFGSFMELSLEQLGASSERDPVGALANLDRIMRYGREQAAGTVAASQDPESERLRSLIAARETAESVQDTTPLAARIRQKSQTWKAGQEAPGRSLSRKLERLTDGAALLTFYFTPKKVYAWIGGNDGLKLEQIPWSADQSAALSEAAEELRWDSANGRTAEFPAKMDELGQRLLAPVAKLLPQVIYFFPSGRLEGFPLDALRWNGEYLAARHKVINLLSLDDLGTRETRVAPDDLQRFFLAGNRQEGAGDFQQLKPPSAELNKIADMFVGPGLHIVQGAALQWDEFLGDRIELAGVVHLAMPGNIDLRNPERSQLMLSDNTSDPAHAFLQVHDIASMKLNAALVVLSACNFTGTNPSAFDQNTRFVNEFLHAGAGAVVASLWNVGDLQAARFMQRFYQKLISTQNATAALFATKQTYLAQNENPDNEAWAAFQLFTR